MAVKSRDVVIARVQLVGKGDGLLGRKPPGKAIGFGGIADRQ
jgi:hypothetical protein